jgi:hypothetical protein
MVTVHLPSTSDASSRPAYLLLHLQAVFSVVASCARARMSQAWHDQAESARGVSRTMVRRPTFTTDR